MNRILKTLALAVVALMVAGNASAATHRADIFGASAQFKFFTNTLPAFLISMGCDATDIRTINADDTAAMTGGAGTQKRDSFAAVCMGDEGIGDLGTGNGVDAKGTAIAQGDTVIVTVTSFSSYEGPRSVLGIDPGGNAAADGCSADQRGIVDLTVSGLPFTVGTAATPKTTGLTMACETVELGTTDVQAATFGQTSAGYANGPCGGSVYETTTVGGETEPEAPRYAKYQPFVVPFAFFLNGGVVGDGSDDIPFDNISRTMAINLYSGRVLNWNEFKADLNGNGIENESADFPAGDNLPVILCLRHAGSGTAATLNAAVMKGIGLVTNQNPSMGKTDFGGTLYDTENPLEPNLPYIYFNRGSGEMVDCVAGSCSNYGDPLGYGATAQGPASALGAIGYADADKVTGDNPEGTIVAEGSGFIKRATYNGVAPRSATIANGQYDFFNANVVYQDTQDTAGEVALGQELMTVFAADPAQINAVKPYWAAQGAINFPKGNDFADPLK